MQEFLMDYGLWLLVALLIVIGVVILLSGRKKAGESVADEGAAAPERQQFSPSPPPVAKPPVAATAPDEPVAVQPAAPVVTPAPQPAEPIPVSPAVTAPPEPSDDLLKLKGVGPKLSQLLIELGVTRYAQIAEWTDADIAAIDARLGNFKGRPARDQWVDQARYLAAGDTAGFEARYGKL
ncbi:hypothetical protein [Sphingobium mellinum]|uniref:hypothetical protein n=1 Tax=Sphingobium mellinum TaxID=1387166 RepID=UPI0030EC7C92